MIINKYYTFGGTEVQTKREKNLLESKGHNVLLLTFDENISYGWVDNEHTHFNYLANIFPIFIKYYYYYFSNKKIKRDLEKIIRSFKPSCIHINHIWEMYSVPMLILAKKYPTLRTIRDYSFICPRKYCVDTNNFVCKGMYRTQCLTHCSSGNILNNFEMMLRIIRLKKVNNLIRKAKINLICPSQILVDFCYDNGFLANLLNNPFDFSLFNYICSDEFLSVNLYLYYGIISKYKGIIQLISAFTKFANNKKDAKLYFAGRIEDDFKDIFNSFLENDTFIYLGYLSYDKIGNLLRKIQVVVVPSLLMDNYPNTVLEGIAMKRLVLSSNRGGMKEMIKDERLIFDILNEQDIIEKLEFAYSLKASDYSIITEANYKRIFVENSIEKYYSGLIEMFSK
jgi:glycosyltransferase involved in cell wall biosynthesis